MNKFLAVAVCLLCAFALVSEAAVIKEKIIATDPVDGKKVEWSWSVSGELVAQKTLGYTNMPGGVRAENISFHTYGKPTRSVALADAVEMVLTGCKIPVFVEGDKRISSFFPLTKKEDILSASLFYSSKEKRFAEDVLAVPKKKYTALELNILLLIGAIIIFILLIWVLEEMNLFFIRGRKYRKSIVFLFSTFFFCYFAPFVLNGLIGPIVSGKNITILLLLGFSSGFALLACLYAFTNLTYIHGFFKNGAILGTAYLPVYVIIEAAIWQYTAFILTSIVIAFFAIPFIYPKWIDLKEDFVRYFRS